MSKKTSISSKKTSVSGFQHLQSVASVEEYQYKKNGFTVLYQHRADTGVITTNITYKVGARDENRGETGLAHMLEHMLFKPTEYDNQHKISEGAAMHFERSTGSVLNANTWKDRTTYYFSYPIEYFEEALRIEADRMKNIVLTDKVLAPEQGNVLSEFDMYNGDPHFGLEVEMRSIAFFAHPYGHETLGYREDIEDFSAEKLDRFYKNYYRPDNATLMIVGDIDREAALTKAKEYFGNITNPQSEIPRFAAREKKQEGIRRVTVERPSTVNILGIGFKYPGFPTKEWFVSCIMLDILVGGPESILYKLLVDSGKAADVGGYLEPTSHENLGIFSTTLNQGHTHEEIEALALDKIRSLTAKDIKALITKSKAGMITEELFGRTESLHIVSELTEYVSAENLPAFGKTTEILESVSTTDVLERIKSSFTPNNVTIGYFKGKN